MEGIIVLDPAGHSRIFVEGYGDMTADVAAALAEMRREDHARVAGLSGARQEVIAQANQDATTFEHGELVASVDEGVFNYWLQREGPGFWRDKGNREAFLRKHPECRVRSRSSKIAIIKPDGYRVSDRRSSAQPSP